jgi:hypothetical protein
VKVSGLDQIFWVKVKKSSHLRVQAGSTLAELPVQGWIQGPCLALTAFHAEADSAGGVVFDDIQAAAMIRGGPSRRITIFLL